jgi:hypothetical protein
MIKEHIQGTIRKLSGNNPNQGTFRLGGRPYP